MIIDKHYPNLHYKKGWYHYVGDIEANEDITITITLKIYGSIYSRATIRAQRSLHVFGDMRSIDGIEAFGHLRIGGKVESHNYIKVHKDLRANLMVYAASYILVAGNLICLDKLISNLSVTVCKDAYVEKLINIRSLFVVKGNLAADSSITGNRIIVEKNMTVSNKQRKIRLENLTVNKDLSLACKLDVCEGLKVAGSMHIDDMPTKSYIRVLINQKKFFLYDDAMRYAGEIKTREAWKLDLARFDEVTADCLRRLL